MTKIDAVQVGWRLGTSMVPRGVDLWVRYDRTTGVYGAQGSGKTLDLLAPALIAHRMQALKELEEAAARDIPTTHRGNWDNPEVWKQNAAEMRERIKAARQTYEQLR